MDWTFLGMAGAFNSACRMRVVGRIWLEGMNRALIERVWGSGVQLLRMDRSLLGWCQGAYISVSFLDTRRRIGTSEPSSDLYALIYCPCLVECAECCCTRILFECGRVTPHGEMNI